ncbi:MAG: hypothetical protein JW863_03460 [Chitinispirillaceae bacterium]|nr:hypothetical protein [Chitinispirillaceae bacterium]
MPLTAILPEGILPPAFLLIICLNRPVLSETGTVQSEAHSVGSALRGITSFSPADNSLMYAAYFAETPSGAVNQVELWYTDALTGDALPDSVWLSWPPSPDSVRTEDRSSMFIDPDDSSHLIIYLISPFPAGITGYDQPEDNYRSTVFQHNPAAPDDPPKITQIVIRDSVGPLLTSATLVERLTAGNDTLYLSFSEPVDLQLVYSQCLTLIKNGMQHQLNIRASAPHPDGKRIVAVVDNALSAAPPLAGDSLKISSTGLITDANGNKAFPENRPVVITLQPVIPGIVEAEYTDTDADGRIETVRIMFNKLVELEDMTVTIDFEHIGSTEIGAADLSMDDYDPNTINVRIDDSFSPSLLQDLTSGRMKVNVRFSGFTDSIPTFEASDGAAPVLTKVEYHHGRFDDSSSYTHPDTIFTWYSEPLSVSPSTPRPLCFTTASGSIVIPTVHPQYTTQHSSGSYRFIVTEVQPNRRNALQSDTLVFDTAWINTEVMPENNVADMSGNVQFVIPNKRVGVTMAGPFPPSSDTRPDTTGTEPFAESGTNEGCGCGTGTGIAFLPPLFYYTRKRVLKKLKKT